jgi:hypothetical protein
MDNVCRIQGQIKKCVSFQKNKTICVFFKKNQFYTQAVKFQDEQDMLVNTLIANRSSGSCHLSWRPDPHLPAIGYGR